MASLSKKAFFWQDRSQVGGVPQPIELVMRPEPNHAANASPICFRMFRFNS